MPFTFPLNVTTTWQVSSSLSPHFTHFNREEKGRHQAKKRAHQCQRELGSPCRWWTELQGSRGRKQLKKMQSMVMCPAVASQIESQEGGMRGDISIHHRKGNAAAPTEPHS